jgi:hypothetical protein
MTRIKTPQMPGASGESLIYTETYDEAYRDGLAALAADQAQACSSGMNQVR